MSLMWDRFGYKVLKPTLFSDAMYVDIAEQMRRPAGGVPVHQESAERPHRMMPEYSKSSRSPKPLVCPDTSGCTASELGTGLGCFLDCPRRIQGSFMGSPYLGSTSPVVDYSEIGVRFRGSSDSSGCRRDAVAGSSDVVEASRWLSAR